MKIAIYGAGYVGLVTGICFAELGHIVCCVDIDEPKINALKQGKLPIYEENLENLLHKNLASKNLQFTTDIALAVDFASIQIIAVGTPSKPDGSADLQYVTAVAEQIGKRMKNYCCIVNKSTVPVGTAKQVKEIILRELNNRNKQIDCDVVSNPEFLREGQAVKDCLAPERIVIGIDSEKALKIMQELYLPLTQKSHPLFSMDLASAELTKYAANAFLATKISFMNEMSQIAEKLGANILAVKKGIGSDSRINEKFLNAGCGFGGSCFPKDVLALRSISTENHYEPHILNAVLKTNDQQQALLFHKISDYFKSDLKNKTIALWGLAFKPNTDDIRCATSRVLMEQLWEAGAKVQAFDPLAMDHIQRAYPDEKHLLLCDNKEMALINADILVVVTEWNEFKNADLKFIKQSLRYSVIFDGRNIFDAKIVREAGFEYYGVGV